MRITDDEKPCGSLAEAWEAKYGSEWHWEVADEHVAATPDGGGAAVFRIEPAKVLAFAKDPHGQTTYPLLTRPRLAGVHPHLPAPGRSPGARRGSGTGRRPPNSAWRMWLTPPSTGNPAPRPSECVLESQGIGRGRSGAAANCPSSARIRSLARS